MDQIIYKLPTTENIQKEEKCFRKCYKCDQVFTTQSSFNEHNKDNHSVSCKKCGKIFINLEQIQLKYFLKRHDRICDYMVCNPMEVDNMNCKLCVKNFKVPEELKRHFETVHNKNHYCETCGNSFSRQKDLLHHVQTVHEGQKDHQCDSCGKTFSLVSSLDHHRKKFHLLQLDHKCEICGLGFVRRAEVRRHVAKYHEKILDYKCEFCFRGFFTNKELKQHIFNAHKNPAFKCEICGEMVDQGDSRKNRNRLRDHIIQFHNSVRLQACDKCDRSFHLKSDLLVHYNLCHKDQKSMKCRVCGKTFESRIELHKHKSSAHPTTEENTEKPWKCKSCEAEFSSRSNLLAHVKGVHRGIKRIKWK